ncbi:MAG: hypothetical protein QGG50_03220, partial [Methanopyri archaeon]|nr:hypothetical protein [Methanopyri archaeon]
MRKVGRALRRYRDRWWRGVRDALDPVTGPARGGTDINGALTAALGVKTDPKRPYIVAFLTDGLPTVGVTDASTIVKNALGKLCVHTRVFCFGVGAKVNTHLLDEVAGKAGGTAQYVEPKEDIEVAVSSFYDKVSHPVLGKPRVS